MARQDPGAAEPVRFALVGLLMSGASHGYDLARRFTPGTALGDIVRLSPSHLYALLARLERAGMIVGEAQPAGAATESDAAFMDLMRAGRIGRARDALAWLDLCEKMVLAHP